MGADRHATRHTAPERLDNIGSVIADLEVRFFS